MHLPLISIIVPVYNAEVYISKCMDSLLNQTLSDIEIICVNDVSTDNSLKILEDYANRDSRIKIISNKENLIAGSYNVGINAASGKYVAVVDNDDWIEPNMYERLYGAIVVNDCDVAFCNYLVHYGPDNIEKRCNGDLSANDFNSIDNIPLKILEHPVGPPWSCLIKKDLYERTGIWFPEHKFFADNAVSGPLLASAKSIVKIDDYLYHWRYDNISITRRRNDCRMFSRVDVAVIFLDNLKKTGIYDSYKEISEYRFYELGFRNTLYYYFKDFDKISLKRIRDIRHQYRTQTTINIAKNKYYIQNESGYERVILSYVKNIYWGWLFHHIVRPIAKRIKQIA